MHLLLLGLGPPTALASTILTGEPEDYFGGAVSAAGDVDGDGYADVVVGADGFDAYTGRIYVFMGSSAGVSVSAARMVVGPSVGSIFGYDVAGRGTSTETATPT